MIVFTYAFFGILASFIELIVYRLVFYFTSSYKFSSYISYLISSAISFFGNLVYGFKVSLPLLFGTFLFLFVVSLNLVLLHYLSIFSKISLIRPSFAALLNIMTTSLLNLVFYYLISLAFISL